MPVDRLFTFEELCQQTKAPKKRHALLGNGFSRAFDNELFAYKSLAQAADFGDYSTHLQLLFDAIQSRDFEYAANILDNAAVCVDPFTQDLHDPHPDKQTLQGAASRLRTELGRAILLNHPIASTIVSEAQSRSCAGFIRAFSSIFTTNYDLLLYWVLMQRRGDLRKNKYQSLFRDGFGWGLLDPSVVLWPSHNSGQQNVFYIHGALHLFKHQHGVEKLKYAKGQHTVKQAIADRVDAGSLPIIVSEGAANSKLDRVLSNPYLAFCYQKLLSLTGSLITYGFGFNANDSHIRHAIVMSHVTELWIGCHCTSVDQIPAGLVAAGATMEEQRKSLSRNAGKHMRKNMKPIELRVQYYSTTEINPWNGRGVASDSEADSYEHYDDDIPF